MPTKVIDVPVKCISSRGFEFISEKLFHFGFEDIQAHSVDRVLQTRVLTARESVSGRYAKGDTIRTLHDFHCRVEQA